MKTIDGEVFYSKEEYDLCELENSNLRRHLAWAGSLLTQEQKIELAKRIRGLIDEGGVVKDASDDTYEENKEIKRLCVKAAGLLRTAISVGEEATLAELNWFSKAEDLASKLMEFDPPTPEASLAEIRNIEESMK